MQQPPKNPSPVRMKGSVEDLHSGQVKSFLKEFKVANLKNYDKISQDIQVSTSIFDDRMNRVPIGIIAIYKDHLKAGLHFSLQPFIIRIFNLYKVIWV